MARVGHFEIHSDNPERAIAFYGGVFGWEFTKWGGGWEYWMIKTGPAEEPAEALEAGPRVLVQIADASGRAVRRLEVAASAGLGRVTWDLRAANPGAINLSPPGFRPPWAAGTTAPLVAPGRYTATLVVVSAAGARAAGEPRAFVVKPVRNLPATTNPVAVAAFQAEVAELQRQVSAMGAELGRVRDMLRHARAAVIAAPRADAALFARIDSIEARIAAISVRLNGDPARQQLDQSSAPAASGRVGAASSTWDTRQMPTATQRASVAIATTEIAAIRRDLRTLVDTDLARLVSALEAAGAPWSPGRRVPPSP